MRRWAWHFLSFRVFAESTIYGFYICGRVVAVNFCCVCWNALITYFILLVFYAVSNISTSMLVLAYGFRAEPLVLFAPFNISRCYREWKSFHSFVLYSYFQVKWCRKSLQWITDFRRFPSSYCCKITEISRFVSCSILLLFYY